MGSRRNVICLLCVLTVSSLRGASLLAQEDQIVYEVRSAYQLITVRDTANGFRQLIFDGRFDGTDAIQSEMNLHNRDELTLSYTRHIMTALPLAARYKRILILGLGGACMQRYLYRLLPEAVIETAELDPEIRTVAAEYFFFREDNRQVVHLGDGRKFIENAKEKYDVIFLDAFSATSIPYHLSTREFLASVKEHLADGGLACANLWDESSDFHDILKTYASVFPELHLLKCAFSGNSILMAVPRMADLTVKTWAEKANVFEQAHPTGLRLAQLIEQGARDRMDIPAAAKILRDKEEKLRQASSAPADRELTALLLPASAPLEAWQGSRCRRRVLPGCDPISGISGRVQYPGPGDPLAILSARSLPLKPGSTTSLIRK
jgi:spermidine synthase